MIFDCCNMIMLAEGLPETTFLPGKVCVPRFHLWNFTLVMLLYVNVDCLSQPCLLFELGTGSRNLQTYY